MTSRCITNTITIAKLPFNLICNIGNKRVQCFFFFLLVYALGPLLKLFIYLFLKIEYLPYLFSTYSKTLGKTYPYKHIITTEIFAEVQVGVPSPCAYKRLQHKTGSPRKQEKQMNFINQMPNLTILNSNYQTAHQKSLIEGLEPLISSHQLICLNSPTITKNQLLQNDYHQLELYKLHIQFSNYFQVGRRSYQASEQDYQLMLLKHQCQISIISCSSRNMTSSQYTTAGLKYITAVPEPLT